MPDRLLDTIRRHRAIVAVTVLQAACAVYFVFDVLTELPEFRAEPTHPLSELLAVIALLIGTSLGFRELRRVLAQNDRMASRARAASGAFLDLMEESFSRWGLTPSERDVALLAVKGLSVAEIATLRRTQAGTVKAQSAAIYRKAGVNSRAELLSLFIEDLMSGVVLDAGATPGGAPPDPRGDQSRSDVAMQHFPP
jgi:DNA-binding NarL/FixJ family response regulator